MSIVARRRKVASSQRPEGGSDSETRLSRTWLSMKLRAKSFRAGRRSMGESSGTVARNTATWLW